MIIEAIAISIVIDDHILGTKSGERERERERENT
jgi:hypothetical protein